MPRSMTGFASLAFEAGALECGWELRSVNHRFLDVSFRLPEDLRRLEPACRELITKYVKRGKLDCLLRLKPGGADAELPSLDHAALASLSIIESAVRDTFEEAQPLTVGEILRFDGVLRQAEPAPEEVETAALEAFARALERLGESRSAEGARIRGFLEERIAAIEAGVAQARPRLEGAVSRYREKLLERVRQLDIAGQPERVEQELVIVAQRMDIAEELDRLMSHVSEIRLALTRNEPIGRRLDFLIQELNREVNTMSSKSPDEELTRIAVELKVIVEQMREQVQNLE
jgi:uncharacterized protein (TIGR00255 family)